jgi:hypothetical protein
MPKNIEEKRTIKTAKRKAALQAKLEKLKWVLRLWKNISWYLAVSYALGFCSGLLLKT